MRRGRGREGSEGHRADGQRAGKQTRANKHNFLGARCTDGQRDKLPDAQKGSKAAGGRGHRRCVARSTHGEGGGGASFCANSAEAETANRYPFFRPSVRRVRPTAPTKTEDRPTACVVFGRLLLERRERASGWRDFNHASVLRSRSALVWDMK